MHLRKKAGLISLIAGVSIELIIALICPYLLRIITAYEALMFIVQKLFFIDIALEIGRAVNLAYGMTLKSTVDSIYPVILTDIFTFLIGVGGTYLFGIVFNWGIFASL